jgi:intracellular septation protein
MKLFFDLFPLLLFFAAYKFYDIYVATAVAIVASVVQLAVHYARKRNFEATQVVTAIVIVVFGGLTIFLRDNTFIMWKPTIVNWVFAAIVLGSQFVGQQTVIQRLMGAQVELPAPVWRRLNLSWGVFFLIAGALNLYVAFYFAPELDAATREQIWVNFKVWGLLGLTFVFVIAQAFYMARYASREGGGRAESGTGADASPKDRSDSTSA